jgi:hypothetical protein
MFKPRGRPAHTSAAVSREKCDADFGKSALGGATTESRNASFLKKEDEKKHGGYVRSEHHADHFKNHNK